MSVVSKQINPQMKPACSFVPKAPERDVFQAVLRQKEERGTVSSLKDYLFTIVSPLHRFIVRPLCGYLAFKYGVNPSIEIDSDLRAELGELGGSRVDFKAEDGAHLEGMYFAGQKSGGKTVLICSGSHRSFEFYTAPMAQALLAMGHSVMLFNYRGFGESRGRVFAKGFNLDAEAAYQYLRIVIGLKGP